MTLQELKDWVNGLPEDFLEYQIVHAEIVKLDDANLDEEDDYTVRLDKPITALTVDEENKEILIMNDYDGKLEDLDFSDTE